MFFELLRVLCSFAQRHQFPLGRIKLVGLVARRHMQVVMPDILVACRLIMLAGGYAIAGISRLHCQSNLFGNAMDVFCVVNWQIVDILEVLIGNDDYVPVIVRPLMRTDKGCNSVIAIDNIALNRRDILVFGALNEQAKWAKVIFGSVVIHAGLVVKVRSGSLPG